MEVDFFRRTKATGRLDGHRKTEVPFKKDEKLLLYTRQYFGIFELRRLCTRAEGSGKNTYHFVINSGGETRTINFVARK